MKEVTKLLINDFRIKKLHYDFMGYSVKRDNSLSFHHLIIPHKECKHLGIGKGYFYLNGAILVQETSHSYLHIIERIDPDMFFAITSEMIDENIKGKLDIDNLKNIRNILIQFEREHCSDRDNKGRILIRESFITDRITL